MYSFHRRNDKTGELFNDGSHILYVNAAYKDDTTRIGQLMHDFRCKSADEMNNKVIADKVRYFKEKEGGHGSMCQIVEEIATRIAKDMAHDMAKDMANDMAKDMAIEISYKVASKAKVENSIKIATELIKMRQLSLDMIAKTCELKIEEVENLAKSFA